MSNDQQYQKKNSIVKEAIGVFGNLSGMLSLAVLIWRGGAMAQVQQDHSRRLETIEKHSVMQITEHVALDNERVNNLKERTRAVEAAVLTLPEIKQDVAIIKVRLTELIDHVNRDSMRQQTTKQ